MKYYHQISVKLLWVNKDCPLDVQNTYRDSNWGGGGRCCCKACSVNYILEEVHENSLPPPFILSNNVYG